jgi:hypothetical protein
MIVRLDGGGDLENMAPSGAVFSQVAPEMIHPTLEITAHRIPRQNPTTRQKLTGRRLALTPAALGGSTASRG